MWAVALVYYGAVGLAFIGFIAAGEWFMDRRDK